MREVKGGGCGGGGVGGVIFRFGAQRVFLCMCITIHPLATSLNYLIGTLLGRIQFYVCGLA